MSAVGHLSICSYCIYEVRAKNTPSAELPRRPWDASYVTDTTSIPLAGQDLSLHLENVLLSTSAERIGELTGL